MGVQHYDIFSPMYDAVTGGFHRSHRAEAVAQLRLEPGQTVLDAPCGTGASLPLIAARTGPLGRLIGVDFSPGMLRQARRRVERKQLTNTTLVEGDAREIDHDMLGVRHVDAVLCMLGLTVIPDWETVVERTLKALRPGGRYVAMDLYLAGKRTSRVSNAFFGGVANADSTRRWWEPLEASLLDVERRDFWWLGGVARVVAGTKK